jgi:AcrR family transcriptional regulator
VGHREALLEGAITCIQEKGYAGTTTRELVAVSGTNLGSIGYHFGSKERLLAEAVTEGFKRWLAQLTLVAFEPAEATPWERLRLGLVRLFETLDENRPLLTAFFESLPVAVRSEVVRSAIADCYALTRQGMRELIVQGVGEANMEGIDPRVIASLITAISDGLIIQWMLDPEAVPTPDEVLTSFQAAIRLVPPPDR